MKRIHFHSLLLAAMALLLITTVASAAMPNPGIMPPTSRVQGLTYAQWQAKWWQYAFSVPGSTTPQFGATTDCLTKRVGDVVLAIQSPFNTGWTECTIPADTMLYLEVAAAECSTIEAAPFYGGNKAELTACAHAFVPKNVSGAIDGRVIYNMGQYLTTTPMYGFTVPTDDNIFLVPAGTTANSVGYGVFVMLKPMSVGVHTLHLYGEYPDFGYVADRNIHITVTP
jgi:hypothetical protein